MLHCRFNICWALITRVTLQGGGVISDWTNTWLLATQSECWKRLSDVGRAKFERLFPSCRCEDGK